MLRKLIIFLITSGLAKKAYDAYRARPQTVGLAKKTPKLPTHSRATTVAAPAGVSSFHTAMDRHE